MFFYFYIFHPRLQWRSPTTEPVVQKPIQNTALLALCLQPTVVSGLPHAGTGSKNRAVAEGWSQHLGFGLLPLALVEEQVPLVTSHSFCEFLHINTPPS